MRFLILAFILTSCSKTIEINRSKIFPYSTKISGQLTSNGNVSEKFQAVNDKIVYIADQTTDTVDDLYIVNVDGSGLKNLTNLSIGKKVTQFVISPLKNKIAFLADINTTGRYDLYTINLDGSSLTRVNFGLSSNSETVSNSFRFTNNGSRIIYASNENSTTRDIFIVNLDGSNRTRINTTLNVFGSFLLATDDSRVVYRNISTNPNLFSANLTGTVENQLNQTFNLITNPAAGVQDFKISPNNNKVVYRANQDNGAIFELYSVNLDGSGAKTKINGSIVSGGLVSSSFDFSPDSSKIVYIADQETDETNELYSVNLDGSSLTKLNSTLFLNGDVISFKINDDSLKVAYLANQDSASPELYTINMNGSNRNKINSTISISSQVSYFKISGNNLYYMMDKDNLGVFNLYQNNSLGSSELKLTSAVSGVGYLDNANQSIQISTQPLLVIGNNIGSIREIFNLENGTLVSVNQGSGGVQLSSTALGSIFLIVKNYVVYRYQTSNGYELYASLLN